VTIFDIEAPRLQIPRLTMGERDLRWARVREAMAEAGIDVLVCPQNTGYFGQFQADSMYLTSMGAFDGEVAVVFPSSGEPTAWIQSDRYVTFWQASQDWCSDVRGSHQRWSEVIVTRLKELGLDRATIGVAGLAGLQYASEGVAPYRVIKALEEDLPDAKIVNAHPMLRQVRTVKSDEEVAALRRGVRIAELSADAAAAVAGEGVPDAHVYGAILNEMLRNEGWLPTLVVWLGSPTRATSLHYPTQQPMAPGDILSMAIEGNYCGYRGQIIQPMTVGPLNDLHQRMFDTSVATWNFLAPLMKPGITYRELAAENQRFSDEQEFAVEFFVQARGVGEDWPGILGKLADDELDEPLRANNTLAIKPRAVTHDPPRSIIWGEMVVVTETGGQRLGSRPQAPIVV
jgi:Xaa-Pro dipeptidase